jgi:hypothetical protein
MWPFRNEMTTDIAIAASPESVWRVLLAFRDYREWNPVVIGVAGEAREGARLSVRFQPIGTRGYTFRPKLLVVRPPQELRWLGWPRFPFVLDTEHYFTIREGAGGGSRLEHGLLTYGLGAPLAARRVDRITRSHFDAWNQALKQRTEQVEHGGDRQ